MQNTKLFRKKFQEGLNLVVYDFRVNNLSSYFLSENIEIYDTK